MPYCSLCKRSTKNNEFKVVRVPKDPLTRQLWEQATGQKFEGDCRICDTHFDASDWRNNKNKMRRRLKPDALPKKLAPDVEDVDDVEDDQDLSDWEECDSNKRIRLMPDALPKDKEDLDDYENSNSPQSEDIETGIVYDPIQVSDDEEDQDDYENSNTQTKVNDSGISNENNCLKQKIEQLQQQNVRLSKELKKYDALNNGLNKILTETQIKKIKNAGQKVFWSNDDISYAISLNAAGPRAFSHLNENSFFLPNMTTLHEWWRNLHVEPGILDVVINLMSKDVDLSAEEDKMCVLMFDKMKVSSNSESGATSDVINETQNYVQLAMARGLRKAWKQPIYFDFDCGMDIKTLHSIIQKMHNAGFPVVAIVSDLGPANRKLWKELGINNTKTWFQNPANAEMKVFVFADVPQLLKLVRHIYLDSGLRIDENIITSATIQQVLNHTSASDGSISSELTADHLTNHPVDSENVKLATQLISNTTANAIMRYQSLGYAVDNAIETASFFKLANDWYDIFNSRLIDNSRPTLQPYGMHLVEQNKILDEMTRIMKQPIVPNSAKISPIQIGVLINNASLKEFYRYLGEKYNMKYLVTNGLTQNVLEQFLGSMLMKNELQDHPSALQFKYRLRKYLMNTFL